MPSITPQVRASIGGSTEDAVRPRATIVASTGAQSTLQRAPAAAPAAPKTGQPSIVEETPASPAVTLSPQLTALARKQQKLQQEIQAQRDREAAWNAEKANYIPRTDFKTQAEQNATEALKSHLGMSYEELTNLILAQQNGQDPVRELRSEFEQLKKTQEETTNKQYEATLKQYRAEADALIATDAKAFHMITKGKHQDAVVQHIVETWQENPEKVLTVAQAAKEVEEFLRAEAKAYADSLKELEPDPVPAEEPAAPAKKTLPPPKAAAPRTLTQQVETAPTRTYGQFQHLSMKERIAQAVARAQR